MNKTLFIAILVLFNSNLATAAEETVHHPVPTDPTYVQASWYETLKKELTPPPKSGSAEQKLDEKRLLSFQKNRSESDCKRAKTEVFVSVNSFFGAPYGPLTKSQAESLTGFFEHVRNDADFFIQKLKLEYPRKRPFAYVKGLQPCIPREVTNAYPSGHAVLAELYALVLSDLFPEKKEALLIRADQIAMDRVLSGMHHPTDIVSGKKIGAVIYTEFKKSKVYRAELEQNTTRLAD